MEAIKKQQIVPDVIKEAPEEEVSVKFAENEVHLGNKLTPTKTKDEPVVTWNADAKKFYTLCMTDPDAPNRKNPKFREWHHWLVVNIPGNDLKSGEVLSEYIPPAPPKNGGQHRYVILIYLQKKKEVFEEPKLTNTSGTDRANFSIQKFAEKYEMGDPIAANFFLAEWDKYVPTIYKQLEGK